MHTNSYSPDMVLIVDDHEPTRRAISHLLRYKGYDVRTASSGNAALRFLDVCEPDAVVLDLGMPDIDGVQILSKLRLSPRIQRIPVLIFSGDSDYLARSNQLDADELLIKGAVSWETFVKKLARLLGTDVAS